MSGALREGAASVDSAKKEMVDKAKATTQDINDARTSGTDLGTGLTDKTESAINEGTPDVTKATSNMTKSIDETIKTLPDDVQPYASAMMDALLKGITEGDPLVQTAISTAADNVISIVEEKLSRDKGVEIITTFMGGMESGVAESTITETVSTTADDAYNALADKLSEDNGNTIGSEFSGGIEKGFGDHDIKSIAEESADGIVEAFSKKMNETAGRDPTSSFTGAIKDTIEAVYDPIVTLVEKIAEGAKTRLEYGLNENNGHKIGYAFSNGVRTGIGEPKSMIFDIAKLIGENVKVLTSSYMSSDMGQSIGLQFAYGLASGISKGVSNVVSAIVNLCRKAVAEAKDELDIHSPSRVARDEIGMMFDKGLAAGLTDGMKIVTSAASNVAESMHDSFLIDDPSKGTVYTSRQQVRQTASATAYAASKEENSSDRADRIGKAIADRLIASGVLDSDIYMDKDKVGVKTANSVSTSISRKSRSTIAGRSLQGVMA